MTFDTENPTPLEILGKRYASGEISGSQFDRLTSKIRGEELVPENRTSSGSTSSGDLDVSRDGGPVVLKLPLGRAKFWIAWVALSSLLVATLFSGIHPSDINAGSYNNVRLGLLHLLLAQIGVSEALATAFLVLFPLALAAIVVATPFAILKDEGITVSDSGLSARRLLMGKHVPWEKLSAFQIGKGGLIHVEFVEGHAPINRRSVWEKIVGLPASKHILHNNSIIDDETLLVFLRYLLDQKKAGRHLTQEHLQLPKAALTTFRSYQWLPVAVLYVQGFVSATVAMIFISGTDEAKIQLLVFLNTAPGFLGYLVMLLLSIVCFCYFLRGLSIATRVVSKRNEKAGGAADARDQHGILETLFIWPLVAIRRFWPIHEKRRRAVGLPIWWLALWISLVSSLAIMTSLLIWRSNVPSAIILFYGLGSMAAAVSTFLATRVVSKSIRELRREVKMSALTQARPSCDGHTSVKP